jgi:hypothetical protein
MKKLSLGMLILVLVAPRGAECQRPVLTAGGGAGIVLRDGRNATVGFHLSLSSHWAVKPGVLLGLEVMGDSYGPWQFANDLCPPGGCPPRNEDRTMVAGLLVTGTLRKNADEPNPDNPIYPVFGAGIYGVAEGSVTNVSPGLTAGLGVHISRQLLLEARYHWVVGDGRVNGFLPLSLLWVF